MLDMRKTVIPKSDQLNADDLIGRTMTIKVASVRLCGEADQPIAVSYEGDSGRPYKPCKSMRRVMIQVWGPYAEKYVGQMMTLYRDPKVKFGGGEVGGIRISHMTGLDRQVVVALTETRAKRQPFRVQPMPANAKPEGYQAVPFIQTALAKMAEAANDPAAWVAALLEALNGCLSADDLAALERADGVPNARKKAPKEIRDQIEAGFSAAAARLAEAAVPDPISNDPSLEQQDSDGWSGPQTGEAA